MARNRSEQKRKPSADQPPTGPKDRDDEASGPLADSERSATEQEPQNFRDEANADKVPEIGPDVADKPIQGIDPVERGRRER
jgi:hypothetical protein